MDLITLEEYKAYKKIGNPEKDGIYSVLISAVSDLIKTHCGKTFVDHYATPRTEIFSVNKGVNALLVDETPIRLLSGVTSQGEDITSYVTIDADLGIVHHNDFFAPGVDIVSITYTGGYEEAPNDIKLAALELVDYYAQGEHTARKSYGGSTVEYEQHKDNWPFHIRTILDSHRDV